MIHHVIRIFLSLFKKYLVFQRIVLISSLFLVLSCIWHRLDVFLLLLTFLYLTIDGSWLKEEAPVNTVVEQVALSNTFFFFLHTLPLKNKGRKIGLGSMFGGLWFVVCA